MFAPQARDSNGVRAACRLRNAQSKRLHATFTHSMRFEILILCAYLRWVTKTKQSPGGGCFCLRRRREIRTGFGRHRRLRNAPIKCPLTLSSYRNSFEIRIPIAYLRWVTKTKQSPRRRLFLFYAAGVRFERGSGGTAACVTHIKRQQLLCKIRYLHETTSFYRFLPHIHASCFAYFS